MMIAVGDVETGGFPNRPKFRGYVDKWIEAKHRISAIRSIYPTFRKLSNSLRYIL